MMNKIKSKIAHYWSDHKIEVIIFAVLVVVIVTK